ncbi:SAF domain-containing protein [Microbacterium album]|uniref:SAF domain-containing protein n=1 Tax=Microbacterium album TaxID=2053191 RepID=A0A917ICB1_9MICO|nr:SAF domain-containing protein [Microbacterium album]GGH37772.1 hypothetical protein GCM10010921_07940 [Microbacterium album]
MTSTTERPVAAAPRGSRRAPWADARFLIGLVLIVASVAGVWLVVGAARQTTPVLAAASTLVPGQHVTAEDVRVVEVALGSAEGAYLEPQALAAGLVALRPVGEGELLPAGAVGDAAQSTRTAVVVRSAVDVPASVDRGAVVELWETPPGAEPGAYETPRVLVGDAVVARVSRDDGVMAAGGTSLELVIERARVADVLAAVAAGSVLSAVPTAPDAGAGLPGEVGRAAAGDPAEEAEESR